MNRRTLLLFALPLYVACLLEAQLNAPRAGVVRYPDGTVHAVYGLTANYVVDPHALASADVASFSDNGGIIAKDGRISLLDSAIKSVAEYQSGESAPVLNIDSALTSAVAWLPAEHALLHWNGAAFVLTQTNGITSLGRVTSLRLAGDTVKLLLTNSDGTVSDATVSLHTGAVISLDTMPGIRGPAVRQESFVLFRDDYGLEIATSSGIIETLPLPAVNAAAELTFERMSPNALHVMSASSGKNWVLHLGSTGAPRLSQLPSEPALLVTTLPEARP